MYWNPLPTVAASAGLPRAGYDGKYRLDPSADYLCGQWAKRDWRNVPGPFYCAETDNCWTGRLAAPEHVIYEDSFGAEIVYRQPRNPHETRLLLSAACDDPYRGYACDGDEHWTVSLLQDWWADRHRLLEWIHAVEEKWSVSTDSLDREAADGLRDYAGYVTGALEIDLREYGFWLEHRRPPAPGEALPDLA